MDSVAEAARLYKRNKLDRRAFVAELCADVRSGEEAMRVAKELARHDLMALVDALVLLWKTCPDLKDSLWFASRVLLCN